MCRHALPLLAALLVGLVASTGRAQDIATEADLLFRRGGQHFQSGKYEDALLAYLASNRLVRNKNALFNIAFCYLRLGDLSEAYRFFSEYTREGLTPDERRSVQQQIDQLRPRVALLSVTSEPPGATVYVDRKDLGARGATPVVLALPAGAHTVMLALTGHHGEQRTVDLVVGRKVDVWFRPRLVLGQVELVTRPPGAEIRVDRDHGRPEGVTPARLALAPGRHAIYLARPGHRPARSEVEVRGGALVQVAATLEKLPPPPAKLVVNASQRGALVVLDGVPVGGTPLTLDLPAGPHRLAIRYEDYAPYQRDLVLAPGERQVVDATLAAASEAEVAAATKMVQSIEEAAASVTVISGEELRAFGYRTLGEALRGVRGFYFTDDRQYQTIGVRGFNPPGDFNTRLLLLADGHVLNDVWTGGSPAGHDFAVDLSDVERIEVVRGPGSALYGTGAFFGVVDVSSRREEEQRFALEAGGGSLGEVLGRGRFFQRFGPGTALRLAGGALYSPRGDAFPAPSGTGTVEENDGERAAFAAGRLTLGPVTLFGRYAERDKRLPTSAFGIVPGTGRAFVRDRRAFFEARWEHALGEQGRLLVRGYYDHVRYDGRWPYSQTVEGDLVDAGAADSAGLEARAVIDLRRWLTLVSGLEGIYAPSVSQSATLETGESLALDNWLAGGSAYALAEARLPRDLRIVTGVRGDYSTNGGFAPSPSVALVWRPYGQGITKFFFGRAFRAPSMYELHYHDGGTTQVPSPDLEPETIYTWQLEHTHALGARVFASASVYFNDVRGLINLGPAGQSEVECTSAEGCVQYLNLGHVGTLGAELELRRSWGPSGSFAVAYAFQHSRDLEAGPFVGEGATPILNSPEHLVYLRLGRPVVRRLLVVGAELIFGSPRLRRDGEETAASLLANLTLSGTTERGALSYSLGAYNLFDWRYGVPVGSEYLDSQQEVRQLGRTFLARLGTSF